ncbi:EscU/YscU/HrcU family type III secretion system export apparatus switch protein [Sporosalibacterium faouarense]|uniref:EscU/YscU/HrcU family type III secretion system export apparatus switch protein n=1 Tax=Sporosalibacterium faouarense TaxID=516123 RepID=UPI00141D369B|nr:EscU/YscU/HrcU family type III secretion system export apparatus switch protein [Sporosalibacterium faouarense]MTI47677.1 flagellar biogenesis protein [Bacillota bacterium]
MTADHDKKKRINKKKREDAIKNKKAIALQYDKSDIAPRVIARGKGYVAENMLQKGKNENVQIHEDEFLANNLINLELGQEIPEELYTAVAEVLAFVYNLDKIKGEKFEEFKEK